jgi:hypothetical protein
LDALDREFALLAASAERTARVQRAEIVHFLETAPRAETMTQAEGQGSSGPYVDPTPDLEPRSGIILARHLLVAYDTLVMYVDQQRAEYRTLPGGKAKYGATIEMRKLVSGIRDLHRSLSWLDAARNPPLDLGTRYFVDGMVAQLVSPDAEVTVVAGERSYGKLSNPFSPVFTLTGVRAPADGLSIVVFIPRREKKSGLLHPLIVHEIAHAANDQHSLVTRVLNAAVKDGDFVTRRKETAENIGGKTPEGLAAAMESINLRLSSWIEEALCDAFGAQLLGPTYLYAFMAIVGTSNLDQASEEHPSTRQRIRLLLRQLDDTGWTSLMEEEVPEVDNWFRQAAKVMHAYSDLEEKFCVYALDSITDLIQREVESHVKELRFRAKEYSTVIKDEMSTLLKAGLPPSQTVKGKRINRASIILGSWLFGIHAKGDDLSALAQAADIPQISLLLPKALQDGALLAAWEESVT